MNQQNQTGFHPISRQLIPAKESTALIWWLAYICFAYHYKVIVCGFFGKTLGYDWLCHTMIHGVTTNHWFEHLVYVPLLWYAFYKVIVLVFGPFEGEVMSKPIQQKKTFALFMLAMYIYGHGMHFFNTTEIYARTHLGINSGALYEQIYWVDEQLSHWVQFLFYFLIFAWIIVYDRLDRVHAGNIAIFTGLLHGLERAIGVIEGDSPYLALMFSGVILIACLIRWNRHGSDFSRVWNDFLFRHGLSFGISMPLALYAYQYLFDGFIQPSSMGNKAFLVVLFVALFTLAGFLISVLIDKLLQKNSNLLPKKMPISKPRGV